MEYSLIANSGIQTLAMQISIDTQTNHKLWFHEWYDKENDGQWRLEPVYELQTNTEPLYYKKNDLFNNGYLKAQQEITKETLKNDGIKPIPNDIGDIFDITFTNRYSNLEKFENVWLPLPYFEQRSEKSQKFGPLNWSRFKLVPKLTTKGKKEYDVVIVFDTTVKDTECKYNESPVFSDVYKTDMEFNVCYNEFWLMDLFSADKNCEYIDKYLFNCVHPDLQRVSQIKNEKIRKMSYIATYVLLIDYIAKNKLFPTVKFYKNTNVEAHNVDMVVDIGNSKTTAVLIEDKSSFNQVRMLQLTDHTNLLTHKDGKPVIRKYIEPFDMNIAFRRCSFGEIGAANSKQFIYPSLVRVGREANFLMHNASNVQIADKLSTCSSPKRYLWDWRPSPYEWRFITLEKENSNDILKLDGIINQLANDGQLSPEEGGVGHKYSRRSLMTFCFLEMLVQARAQVNSYEYRSQKTGFGKENVPRNIKRIIVTCPTAMSELERRALIQCANNAVTLLSRFYGKDNENPDKVIAAIEVVPSAGKRGDEHMPWYYDEATCAQLVYTYGEVGYKYGGYCDEFFKLYGKRLEGDTQNSLTIASVDIGAGTTDLMISKNIYQQDSITTITPKPLFYDSYYYAGDDMLKSMIKNLILNDYTHNPIRLDLKSITDEEFRQKMKNFFGPDHNGQTYSDRELRKDFNQQYSVPLMHYFLELLSVNSDDCVVRYDDIFQKCHSPHNSVLAGFSEAFGLDLTTLEWYYRRTVVSNIVKTAFEPLLKKVATIIYSHKCDVVLLSGRPASLSPIRDIFLKYFPVSPDRLIVLNNYYVGDWYPFGDNTGYIKNPKTIVTMGGVIAHYAAELSSLNNFKINLDELKKGLKSTVKYIGKYNFNKDDKWIITPEQNFSSIVVSSMPYSLRVQQIDVDSYPSRVLYSIDFNRCKMRENFKNEKAHLTDSELINLVKGKVEELEKRMPFTITIEREIDNIEKLSITSIEDKDQKTVHASDVEINLQSLGVDQQYWLDTGVIDF